MRLEDMICEGGFSFLLDGAAVSLPVPEKKAVSEDAWEEVYRFLGGLVITRRVTLYREYDAWDWVLSLKNEGSEDTGILSGLLDCDMALPFPADDPLRPGFRPFDPAFKVINAIGGAQSPEDFTPREFFLVEGDSREFGTVGGRSSSPVMPYVEMVRHEEGVIAAVGWSGDWKVRVTRQDGALYQAGIPDLHFRLHPGEEIRTTRTVLLAYDNGCIHGHNKWRRFMKKHFSVMGQGQRPGQGPVAMSLWGGVSTEECIRRVQMVQKYQIGFEYIWMDAGWYGESKEDCPDEFSGDWGIHAGTWTVNPTYHPDGLEDLAREIKGAGMKFILWCEPERAILGTRWTVEHPDWFLHAPDKAATTVHLNLGNEEAREAVIDLIDGLVTRLDLDCYRQDFNLEPAGFWSHHDTQDRRGITQIKHVMGLYAFWDALLARHPKLFIDNCASGGRRLDIELMKRSMPLWQTDYACVWNYDAEDVQSHTSGAMWWLPYTGTGTGSITGSTYRYRCTYAASFVTARWSYAWQEMTETPEAVEEMKWMKERLAECKRAQPYYMEDYYPLTLPCLSKDTWALQQFDRPEQGDGMVVAFRRSRSSLSVANPELYGLDADALYEVENSDTGERHVYTGRQLTEGKWAVEIPEKGESRMLFYKKVERP